MSSQKSGVEIVLGVEKTPYLHCVYGHGSFKCGSYVTINRNGAFHFCTYPSVHGFSLTLKEVLEIAKEQNLENEVRSYTDQPSTPTGDASVAQQTLHGETVD